jgi:hypothetical protein
MGSDIHFDGPIVHNHGAYPYRYPLETVPSPIMHRPFFAENKQSMDTHTAYFPSTDEKRYVMW